ncbi:MAG: hypothetical protein KGL12_15625 [Rhodospirillales bacterium]|nr:hypothetical protein [Rhodospirillales bacterium]
MRALKFATALMGVLIVLGTTVLIVTIVHRMGAAAPSPSGPAFLAHVDVPTGGHIAGIASAGGRLAVWIAGPGGSGRVVLLDPASGKVAGTVTLGVQ